MNYQPNTMANSTHSLSNLDPDHRSCIGGRTVLTCRNCAGNAPREAICASCDGRGFNIFICAHCNPTAGAGAAPAATRTSANGAAQPTAASTMPGPLVPSSLGSLSRSLSTSYPDAGTNRAWRRFRDGRDGTSCERIETNTPRNL